MCVLAPWHANAFSVQSGFTDSCHETLSITASEGVLAEVPDSTVTLPKDNTWRSLQREFLEMLDDRTADLDDVQRFLLFSLVLGARAPDTDGHSTTNLEILRMSHADPEGEGQYQHASRAAADDYEMGDAQAIEGARQMILNLVEQAEDYLALPPEQQNIKVDFYLDFYGQMKVPVWAPLYFVGKAVHVLQDSFSHSIRTDQDGLHSIAHVLNYVDAIHSGYDENRDGLAHSDHMDRCTSADIEEIVDAAVTATGEMLVAVSRQFDGTDNGAVERVLDNWLVLQPGCTKENDFCGNERWLETVQKDQTGPYLKKAFGCNIFLGPATRKTDIFTLLLMLISL
jgi:hypothetical protein